MVLGQCKVIAREGGSLLLLVRARDLAVHVTAAQDAGWVLKDIVEPPFLDLLGGGRLVVWAVKGDPDRGRRLRRAGLSRAGFLRDLVRCCAPRGRVLDPFAGSGAVALATLAEGGSFLGVEPCSRRYALARRRLMKAHPAAEDAAAGFPSLPSPASAWPPGPALALTSQRPLAATPNTSRR